MPLGVDPISDPAITPTTEPTEKVMPPAVEVIRKISVRPTGAVKDEPSTVISPRLSAASQEVPRKPQGHRQCPQQIAFWFTDGLPLSSWRSYAEPVA